MFFYFLLCCGVVFVIQFQEVIPDDAAIGGILHQHALSPPRRPAARVLVLFAADADVEMNITSLHRADVVADELPHSRLDGMNIEECKLEELSWLSGYIRQ